MQRITRLLFRQHRRFSTEIPKEKVSKGQNASDKLYDLTLKYLNINCYTVPVGGVLGTIYGSYRMYKEDGRTDLPMDYGMLGMFTGIVWPIWVPYKMCEGIGYCLSKAPLTISMESKKSERRR
jgi:hypothetical protein